MSKTDDGASPEKEEVKDLMKIVVGYPPNFELIKASLPDADGTHTYCYGDTIYNPSGKRLTYDIQYHEFIHMQRQEEMGKDVWWYTWLTDHRFRLAEEIKAYGEQYLYAKGKIIEADELARKEDKHLGGGANNILRLFKESIARALSCSAYGNLLSYSEAESIIRNYGKEK